MKNYAQPLINKLDLGSTISHRLYRDHCIFFKNNYTKQLSKLGRDMKKTIIIDNSPHSYEYNPENAIPIISWFEDENDTELFKLIPILQQLSYVDDVREMLANV